MSIIIRDEDDNLIAEWPDRKDLVDLLCEQINEKLANSKDELFKAAYDNVDRLPEIVIFDPMMGAGGAQIAETIKIGRRSVLGELHADGDIMGTLFHEYHHYLNYIYKFRPYKYTNEPKGEIFYIDTVMGEKLQSEEEFKNAVTDDFIFKMVTRNMGEKYYITTTSYAELNDELKKEVDDYIAENNLEPRIVPDKFRYLPSNYLKEEISAHTKTLEAQAMGMFTMSDEKNDFYQKELLSYNRRYERALLVEQRDGYTPEGYKK